ncbi:MAG TPA: hypothetical protein VHJ20_07865 [Polyangia bacterium]|nr:hypothetical protein [Polyangia bacterium]
MTPAAVLVILVAAGDARSAEVVAMTAAAAEVVGTPDAVRVAIDPAAARPTEQDAASLASERELGARAVVRLTWLDGERRRAHLRLHAARTDRWLDREVEFTAADTPPERGRALGFAAASMLPEGDPELRLAPASEEPAPPAPPPPPAGRTTISLGGVGAVGVGGPSEGRGGTLAVDRFVTDALSVGAELDARAGRISELNARALTAGAGVGVGWWARSPVAPGHDVGVGVVGEVVALYHLVSHARVDGSTEWRGHVLPGARVGLEGTWRVARPLELFAAIESETAFGSIDVEIEPPPVTGASTAHIPALRAVGELGILARF